MILISCLTLEEENELAKILTKYSVNFIVYKSKTNINFLNKLSDIVKLFFFIKKHKVSLILGSPCSRNRYLSYILGIKFYCYMRSLHPLPNALTSKSDLLFFYLNRFGLGLNVFNPYYAHKIFITSPINKNFLLSRKINANIIYDIGAVWLDNINVEHTNELRLIYISQAFQEHYHLQAHKEQLETIHYLKKICDDNNIKFYIRQHPRDYTDYYNLMRIVSFKETPNEFLSKIKSKDIFIGSFSTLAIEIMSLGIKYIPLEFTSIPTMKEIFLAQGITTTRKEELIDKYSLYEKSLIIKNIFSGFNGDVLIKSCLPYIH